MQTALIILAFLITIGFAQERKSIHQIDWEKHRHLKKGNEHIDVVDNSIIPLKKSRARGLSKKVFGFLPDWEYLAGAMSNLQFDLLTHIAAFDFLVSSDGSISNPAGWPWTDLINEAHNNGVKVVLTAVNFNGAEINTIISNETVKNNFFANLKDKISLYKLDGVNIDFEGLNNSDKGTPINNFMADLTDFIHNNFPNGEVSFDGPAVNWGNYWDFTGLASSCDYIFIMGYAFIWSGSENSGSTAPLIGGSINITNTVQSQYSSVVNSTPEKLILGVPYYGEKFQTADNLAHSKIIDIVGSTRFRNSKSESTTYGNLWDAPTASPWYCYQSDGKWFQVWSDNGQSIDEKFDLADSKSLLGIGMWALNYDGNLTDFWNVINDHYGDGIPIPGEALDLHLSSYDQNALKINFSEVEFANGYWVYYGKNGLLFSDSTYFTSSDSILSGLDSNEVYFIKVRAMNNSGIGSATGVLASTTNPADQPTVLIIDGFDRQAGNNTRDYIRMHATALFNKDLNFSSATNEAVSNNVISLDDYKTVDWILGDESTADHTFTSVEQGVVKEFLKQGGNLFVTGAEIGWDLDEKENGLDFYNNYLKAEYINDAPNGENLTYNTLEAISGKLFDGLADFTFDFKGDQGTYEVDWPDAINAINGAHNILRYKGAPSANIAGIAFEGLFPNGTDEGKLVYFGFPFETIYPVESRENVISKVFDFFEGTISKIPEITMVPQKFILYQNYPNPFNPITKIRFYMDKPGNASINIYDIGGREVASLREDLFHTGFHVVEFNASNYASGVYIYEVSTNGQHLRKKMTLIK